MSRKTERVEFHGANGDLLAGRLDRPEGEPHAYALFAHCFTCSKDIWAATRISIGLAELGIAVLRFDFTGLGSSEGEFANTNFSSNVGDLVAAAEFMRSHQGAPNLLVGHSLGGAAVLAAASEIPECEAVATIGAPADPEHLRHLFEEATPEIEARGEACVAIAGRSFRIKKQFLDDIGRHAMEEKLAHLHRALAIFHSPQDELVDIDNARIIFEAAKHPKSFISLDKADHLLTDRADAEYVAAVVAAWASRYVDGVAEPRATGSSARRAGEAGQQPEVPPSSPTGGSASDARVDLPPGTVRVTETGTGKYTNVIQDGRHELFADEPASVGGDDRGPSPYELLSASLGACISMTLRMYAERKGWPLEKVSVDLRHERIHAQDCAHCETEEGRIDRIEAEVKVQGPLDDEQRQRLLEIASKCPVHRTLEGEIDMPVRLKEPGS